MELFFLAILISLLLLLAPLKQRSSHLHRQPPAIIRLVKTEKAGETTLTDTRFNKSLPFYKLRRNYRKKIHGIAADKGVNESRNTGANSPSSTIEEDKIELIEFEGTTVIATESNGVLKLKALR